MSLGYIYCMHLHRMRMKSGSTTQFSVYSSWPGTTVENGSPGQSCDCDLAKVWEYIGCDEICHSFSQKILMRNDAATRDLGVLTKAGTS